MRVAPIGSTPTDPIRPSALEGTPYRVIGPLGRGGMGEVLEAEHITLGKRVVVKLLHPELANRRDLVDRMRIEAQALARLDHPNIVTVSDFGQTADGRSYLVMERLWGVTLRDELRRQGRLPTHEALELLIQLLAALEAAHALGLVHRDVKLDNVFVCDAKSGPRVVKLLDFGIAKVVAPTGDQRAPAPLAYPTEEGVAIGTPRFFAPEQARGWKVDARTDVYAAGVVLYALLCGRGPFDDKTQLFDLSRAHAFDPPPSPSRFTPSPLPDDLEAAILKALEKKPEARFTTAGEFGAALGRIRDRLAKTPTEPRWLETETLDPRTWQHGRPVDAAAPAPKAQTPLPRATVRMPELAAAQDAARAGRPVAPMPAAGRPAHAPMLETEDMGPDFARAALAAGPRALAVTPAPAQPAPTGISVKTLVMMALVTAVVTASLVLGVVFVVLK